jgi:hypothetical protein
MGERIIFAPVKYTTIVVILILFPLNAMAFDSWSRGDIAREVAWQAIHLIDWGQTLSIADNPGYHEHNFWMGEHPSRGRVNLYMGLETVLHPLVTHVFPASCRPYWQYVTIGISATNVINNYRIGLKVRF